MRRCHGGTSRGAVGRRHARHGAGVPSVLLTRQRVAVDGAGPGPGRVEVRGRRSTGAGRPAPRSMRCVRGRGTESARGGTGGDQRSSPGGPENAHTARHTRQTQRRDGRQRQTDRHDSRGAARTGEGGGPSDQPGAGSDARVARRRPAGHRGRGCGACAQHRTTSGGRD